MSDDEEEYEYEYDDEEMEEAQSFEYTDEEEEQDDAQVQLENAYYNAKGLRETDLNAAAQAFEQVIQQERDQNAQDSSGGDDGAGGAYGPWSFKAMKQLCKLHLRAANAEKTREHYSRLLQCISTGKEISPNAVEKGINGMLERVASLYQQQQQQQQSNSSADTTTTTETSTTTPNLAVAVYDETLQVFHPKTGACKNERLWFKANIKYGQLLYEMHETAKLQTVLQDLQAIQAENNNNSSNAQDNTTTSSSGSSSTQTMEIYALQIQLYSRQKDFKRLRETFTKAMNVRGGIPHPRTLALMQELGGKMHMTAREYETASKTFFQAFKSYDEAGDPSRLRCLKYLVLASMLHASTINPFDSQEARPYRDDPEILAMTNLVHAFQNNEITEFEKILKQQRGRILQDEFVRQHIQDLLVTVRRQVLRRVIRPYKRITLAAIARDHLNDISVDEVESLLVGLILDGSLNGKIDRVEGVLLKQAEKGKAPTRAANHSNSSNGGGSGSSGAGGGGAGSSSAGMPPGSSGATGGDAAMAANKATSKTPVQEQCEALEDMIARLEELSDQVTSIRIKEGGAGPIMRGMV